MVIINKLKDKQKIDEIFKKGQKIILPFFVCYFLNVEKQASLDYLIIASKKVGGSVQRSRAKRLLRVLLRYNASNLFEKNVNNIVLVARSAILEKKSTELVAIFQQRLERSGRS